MLRIVIAGASRAGKSAVLRLLARTFEQARIPAALDPVTAAVEETLDDAAYRQQLAALAGWGAPTGAAGPRPVVELAVQYDDVPVRP